MGYSFKNDSHSHLRENENDLQEEKGDCFRPLLNNALIASHIKKIFHHKVTKEHKGFYNCFVILGELYYKK